MGATALRYVSLLAVFADAFALRVHLGPNAAKVSPGTRQPMMAADDCGLMSSKPLDPSLCRFAAPAAAGLALLPSSALAGTFDDPSGIAQAFFFVTFVPQNFWLLLVFAPNWKVTRSVFEPLWPLCLVALAHLFIVGASAGQSPEAGTAPIELFNNLFNPIILNERGIDVYQELSNYKNFAAEEWTHELTWDLFVGRWIWLEGRRRNIFTCHSVLLTNLIGPPGLLLHVLTVQIYALFRSDEPDARWSDPEALRSELEGQRAISEGAAPSGVTDVSVSDVQSGFKLPEIKLPKLKNPFAGDEE